MRNQRLELRLLAHSIDAATLSAGRTRRRKSNADVYLIGLALLGIAVAVVVWP